MTGKTPTPSWTDRLRSSPYSSNEAAGPISALPTKTVQTNTSASAATPKAIEITLQIPKLKLPSVGSPLHRARQICAAATKVSKRIWLGGTGVSLLLLALFSIWHIVGSHATPLHSNTAAKTSRASPTPGTPVYSTILPAGETAAQLGGWYRVSPPDRDPVYAFADSIGKVRIDVSEQPLPASFQNDTAEQIAQLATSFGASQKVSVNGTTVYIGTSAQGPQSLILTKSSLLVLIKSTDKLTNDQWVAYVSSLK